MKRVVPAYCRDFHCIAGQCRHSCCIGWEIDIDPDSIKRYDALGGEYGEVVRSRIERSETPHLRLSQGERCPFLNCDGLCDMILKLGEESLCQICTDHPRFYTWLPDRREMGFGLCCEEACRLLLESNDYVNLTSEESDDEPGEAFEDWEEILEDREALFDILREGGNAENMLDEVPEYDMVAFLHMLLDFEIINQEWRAAIETLSKSPELMDSEPDFLTDDSRKLTAYLIYRYYVNYAADGCWDFPMLFAHVSTRVLGGLYGLALREKGSVELSDRVNWLRLWSAELEYDEDSMDAIADFLYE